MNYPILEYDPTREARIEPANIIKPLDTPEHCVICFFPEVIDTIVAEHNAKILGYTSVGRWPASYLRDNSSRSAVSILPSRRRRTDSGRIA